MNQIFRQMFPFPLAHLQQFRERGFQRALDRGPGLDGVNASSGNLITPGACRIVPIVISPGAFNSFCKTRMASW